MRSKNKTHVSTCATILQVCLIREKSGNMFVKWVERLSEIYNHVFKKKSYIRLSSQHARYI